MPSTDASEACMVIDTPQTDAAMRILPASTPAATATAAAAMAAVASPPVPHYIDWIYKRCTSKHIPIPIPPGMSTPDVAAMNSSNNSTRSEQQTGDAKNAVAMASNQLCCHHDLE